MEVKKAAGSAVLLDEIKQWSSTFSVLMKSNIGRQVFTKFLQTEFSDENMLFWNSCEEYKDEKSSVKRQIMANEIYEMFLTPSAPFEVDVGSNVRKELLLKMNENPTSDIFNDAQDHVYRVMERDSWMRFVRSKTYSDFMKQLETGEYHIHNK